LTSLDNSNKSEKVPHQGGELAREHIKPNRGMKSKKTFWVFELWNL